MTFEYRGIKGPDVSFYQGSPNDGLFIDFEKMKNWRDTNRSGVNFVIIKAGQHTWKDPAFDYNWREARRVGIPRAAYFFLDKDGEGKAQAELFWKILKGDAGEGPLIVDFEWGSGEWSLLYDFLVRLKELSGYQSERIWIYTGKYYWINHGPRTQAEKLWFAQFPLWLAKYSHFLDLEEDVPAPWFAPVMWQKGTTIVWGLDLGVHSLELDWNWFGGDMAQFKRYFIYEEAAPNEPEEPQEGGTEVAVKYRVIWGQGVARRKAPHTGTAAENTYTGLQYPQFAEVEVVKENIADENDPTNGNKVWVEFADGYFGASKYPTAAGVPATRMEKIVAPDPEPEPTEPVKVHQIDIYEDGKVSIDGGEPF